MSPKEQTAQEVFDAKVAKVIAAEMCGSMSEDDAKKFVKRLGRLAASIELIAPSMKVMGEEMAARRRIVERAIRREHPSMVKVLVGTAAGAALAGVKVTGSLVVGMASRAVSFLRRKKDRWSQPRETWSVPMLQAELERKKVEAAAGA